MSVAYIQRAENFVAGKVFPEIRVEKQAGAYATYTQADWFRDEAQVRGETDTSEGGGYNVGTANYSCLVYAFHKLVGDKTRANAHAVIDMDRDAVEFVTQRMLLRQERDWMTKYFNTGIWGTTTTPGNLWSDFTSSDPRGDINTGKKTILQNTGMEPNTLVLSYDVYDRLQLHPELDDKIKYTSAETITESAMARLFGVDRVLVTKSIYNTAVEGATASYSFNSGKHALLCYVAPRPSMLMPSAGYNFVWSGVAGGLGTSIAISTIRDDHRRADKIEAEAAWDFKVVATNLGYFFYSTVA
jgi:hypothetical protein